MKNILLALCISLTSLSVPAQNIIDQLTMSYEEKGDLKTKQFAYSDALNLYQKALDNGGETHLYLKMAESYRKLNDPENAEIWYQKGLEGNDTISNPEYFIHYAEALSSNKKYAESKIWYQKFLEQSSQNKRVNNRIQGIDNQQQFFKNVNTVSVTKADFNSESSDFSPTFYNGDLVFVSARQGKRAIPLTYSWDKSEFLDLYILKDGEVKPFNKVHNSRYHEGPAVFYSNNTKMIFTRSENEKGKPVKNEEGIVKLKLYYSELHGSDEWSEPALLSLNSENHSVGHPAINISAKGAILYFASDMPGGFGGVDLYVTKWEGGDWGTPTNLGPNINTEGDELFPTLNGGHLYFASDGHPGLGGLDLFGSDISKGYKSRVVNLGAPINGSMDDFGIALEKSGLTGYISSNREGSLNRDNIYAFTASKILISNYLVTP